MLKDEDMDVLCAELGMSERLCKLSNYKIKERYVFWERKLRKWEKDRRLKTSTLEFRRQNVDEMRKMYGAEAIRRLDQNNYLKSGKIQIWVASQNNIIPFPKSEAPS